MVLILGVSLLIPAANAQGRRGGGRARMMKMTATLAGNEQVPPVESSATGSFTLMPEGRGKLAYTLDVNGLTDPTMAHLHMAAMGKDGPPVVWLYGDKMHPATKTGEVSGMLAQGTITAADLVGPMKGKTLADLMREIRMGNIYVNVHTKAHPAGELRGQVKGE
jgi:CHRD domain